MPDEQRSSTATTLIVVLLIAVVLGLAGLCLCGGLGIFFFRATSIPPAPGQPTPLNEPMLKRLIDEATGSAPIPPLPPPAEEPPIPVAPEPQKEAGESADSKPPTAERDDPNRYAVP